MYNNHKMKMTITRAVALGLLVFLSGCVGGTVRYINPNANFSYIKNVAVLPFNNFSGDRYAGEKVRSALTVDLMSRGVFEITEKGEVSKVLALVLRSSGGTEGTVVDADKETLKLIGERLGVQAVVLGSVYEFGKSHQGGAVVSISVRMIDTSSGIVLWTAKSDISGTNIPRQIIGVEETNKTVLTRKAVKSALDTLL